MADATLYLIPVDLAEEQSVDWVGAHLEACVRPLRRFVVEHPKAARRFLKKLDLPLQELELEVLDEHAKPHDIDRLAGWLAAGGDAGLMSEAGAPGIADPGAALVRRAHALGVRVVPLVGPSSLLLALMASGLNGQRFTFNGYLPQDASARNAGILELEARSRKTGGTEIFIEAPYRNDQVFASLLAACQPGTLLTVACEVTAPGEQIETKTIGEWRRIEAPKLHKRPTVFLLLAGNAPSAHRRSAPARAE